MRGVFLILVLFSGALHAHQKLPVFLADNHAETFAWIARTFEPDERFQLVLIDAHSDASAAERSEEIREQLRRVPSLRERTALVEHWRETARLQAFNWIEPLMPRPIEHVLWIAKPELTETEATHLTNQAVTHLDGRLEVEPRSSGSFSNRWQTRDIDGLSEWNPGDRPVILSFDLDFLTGMTATAREQAFDRIWARVMDWPGLFGVSFSVSRPWLVDDAEADALVMLASAAVARTCGATLEIHTAVDAHPDHSKQAATSATKPARRDASSASPALRATWNLMGDSLKFIHREIELPDFSFRILPDTGEMDCDGIWRFPVENAPALRVQPPATATGRVRWFALEPARAAYDFLPHTGLGKTFSDAPARWIYQSRRHLRTTTDFALAAADWSPESPGQIRLEAEVETSSGWLPTTPIEIRLTEGTGFHAALSECFRMPYGFGIAGISQDPLNAVETGWASDCSNLLIHAWRRNGIALAWGDPGQLRRQLTTLAENLQSDDNTPLPPGTLENGIMIDFGKHVAALWQDGEPLGVLDGNDLVTHHLGGFPETVTLATLARDRPRFALRIPKNDGAQCTVKLAGDIVLASEEMAVIPGFEKGTADLFIANLEGIPSTKHPDHPPRYDFRFPAERLKWLVSQGVDGVSMANNHAGDAGPKGLLEGLQTIRAAGIDTFGAGKDEEEACQPWRAEANGVPLAIFGVSIVKSLKATSDQPGVACLPDHGAILEEQLKAAKAKGDRVIVMVHGGDEYSEAVNDAQRMWSLWLINRGADLIAGSHPHVIQRREVHAGATIFHSLGNAVYPKALTGADSGKIVTQRLFSKVEDADFQAAPTTIPLR
jgi:hypothetical protein